MERINVLSNIKTVDIRSRCEFSSQLEVVSEKMNLNIPYYKDAIIPVGEWQSIDKLTNSALFNVNGNRHYNTVSINTLPSDTFKSIRDAYKNSNHEKAIKLSKNFFGEKYSCHKNELNGGISEMIGMKPTVSFNSFDGKHVGLHVDSWDRLNIEDRYKACNRLSLNLGDEKRYFMFIPLCLHSLVSYKDRSIQNATIFGRSFIINNNPIVIRLKIFPGEYYIAPTENCIHDGSSLGGKSVDVTLSLRGKIW